MDLEKDANLCCAFDNDCLICDKYWQGQRTWPRALSCGACVTAGPTWVIFFKLHETATKGTQGKKDAFPW